MVHCTKCGATIAEDVAFCGACGAPQTVPAPGANPGLLPATPNPAAHPQMSENLAATLSYALGWLTGLIFYLIDKRPFVRFHAAQSIVVFGALHVLTFIFGAIFGLSWLGGGWEGFSTGLVFYRIVHAIAFILWIVLMIKAHQGQRFRVPLAADAAERIFGKS
jgi:uncharacterized membrane protein